jgi:hypothetical protein
MHRKVAAALVAALALAVASCGGSEETLTRAQLVNRIEQACRDGQLESQRQMRAAGRSGGTSAFIDAVLAGQRQELDAIDDFKVPDAAKADYEALKAGVQDRVEAIERAASADRADIQRAMRSVQAEAEAAARKIEGAARGLGVEGCT